MPGVAISSLCRAGGTLPPTPSLMVTPASVSAEPAVSDSPAFRPIRRHIIVGVVGLTALLGACGGDDDVARLTNDPIPLEDLQNTDAIGSDVDIDFTTFDGSTSNFATYAGTPLVVNFFSRTCAHA